MNIGKLISGLPEKKAEVTRKYMHKLPVLAPTEMYRVMMEREEIMIYMPFNQLINMIWELVDELEKTK